MAITVEDLDNAKIDATTLAEVSNSREGGLSTGIPINETITRTGDTINTVQGQLANLGFKIPAIDWTTTTSITSNVQVYRFPITTGDLYVAKVPVPFITGVTFTPSNWQLVAGFDLFLDPLPRLSNFLDPNSNYIGSDKGIDISSAASLVIGTDGDFFVVTGTSDVFDMVVGTNRKFTLQFDDSLIIAEGFGIIFPGGISDASIVTESGDIFYCQSVAINTVIVTNIARRSGQPIVNMSHGGSVPSGILVKISQSHSYFDVTGTDTINILDASDNHFYTLRFTDILTVTHGAFITLPGGVDFITSPGDQFQCYNVNQLDVRVIGIIKADGTPVIFNVLSQDVDGQDFKLSKVNLKDYGETTNNIGSIGGGTQDIDLELGNSVSATVDTSATMFTFSNPTASDEKCSFSLLLTNGGSQTIFWPTSVFWSFGIVPVPTLSGTDLFKFVTIDGGIIWHGELVIEDSRDTPPYDLNNIGPVEASASLSEVSTLSGMAFNNTGTKLYGTSLNAIIYQYPLSTPYNISTKGSVQASANLSAQILVLSGMAFNGDGTKLYGVGKLVVEIKQYPLSTPYDISTKGSVQASADLLLEISNLSGMAFNGDGTKLYGTDSITDTVFQYPLSTPYNISTKGSVQASADLSLEISSLSGMAFNGDGTKLYATGIVTDSVFQYPLSTPYDISTKGSVEASADLSLEIGNLSGMAFNDDGTKLYGTDSVTDTVFQYPL